MKRKTEPCPRCAGTGEIEFSPVRALRLLAGLKQTEVAVKTGITQSNYCRIESGEVTALYHAGKLADLFNVSTDVILGRAPILDPKPARPSKAPAAIRLAASKRRRALMAQKNRKRK